MPPPDPHALHAPPHWRVIECWSDVHLQPTDTATFAAWQHHVLTTQADAVFVLGDWLELWVGDDALDDPDDGPFWRTCAATMRACSRQRPVFFLPGNRDFLIGPRLLAAAGMTALPDPCVLIWNHTRTLLSHGDALCWDDTAYQHFRQQVRDLAWQADFLARPLTDRLTWARHLRQQSAEQKREHAAWVDVTPAAVMQALATHHCTQLIHGHTHMPAVHDLPQGQRRWVLSDWDAQAHPPRLSVLRWSCGDLQVEVIKI